WQSIELRGSEIVPHVRKISRQIVLSSFFQVSDHCCREKPRQPHISKPLHTLNCRVYVVIGNHLIVARDHNHIKPIWISDDIREMKLLFVHLLSAYERHLVVIIYLITECLDLSAFLDKNQSGATQIPRLMLAFVLTDHPGGNVAVHQGVELIKISPYPAGPFDTHQIFKLVPDKT